MFFPNLHHNCRLELLTRVPGLNLCKNHSLFDIQFHNTNQLNHKIHFEICLVAGMNLDHYITYDSLQHWPEGHVPPHIPPQLPTGGIDGGAGSLDGLSPSFQLQYPNTG